jgi:hypothetical protein
MRPAPREDPAIFLMLDPPDPKARDLVFEGRLQPVWRRPGLQPRQETGLPLLLGKPGGPALPTQDDIGQARLRGEAAGRVRRLRENPVRQDKG